MNDGEEEIEELVEEIKEIEELVEEIKAEGLSGADLGRAVATRAQRRGAQLQLQQGAELQRVACFIFCLYVMRLLLLARNCTLERASVLGCACFAVSEICCSCHRL